MKIFRLVLIALVLFAAWEAVVLAFALPPFILPGPLAVALVAWSNLELLARHGLVTLGEILLGTLLGVGLGALAALAMAYWTGLRSFLQPVLVLSQVVPVFALAPLLTLWLGYGFGPKIVMAVLVIFFPVASAFLDGLMRMPASLLDLAANAGATPLRRLFLLGVPAAVPGLLTGLGLALIYAPIGVVIGEWVGASQGLGYLMLYANGRAQAGLMFAALILLTLITLLLHGITMATARWLLRDYLRP